MKPDPLPVAPAGAAPPLVLPRWSRTEAQARTALAQRARNCAVQLGGGQWLLDVDPLAQVPHGWLQEAALWHAQCVWAGAPFVLSLPPDAARQLVPQRLADLDLPTLPEEIALAVLELALRECMDGLSGLRRGPARLEGLVRGPIAAQDALAHALALRLRGPQQEVDLLLRASSLGLMVLAGLVAARPPAGGPLQPDGVPLVLRAELGSVRLAARLLRSLAPGDAVLLEHTTLGEDGRFRIAVGRWGLWVRAEGRHLVVVETLNATELNMANQEHPDTAAALDDVPVDLSFDLGERSITLGELRALQVGQVLELARPLTEGVNIRANGRWIGSGELVDIDGRLAVSIAALAAPRSDA